MPAETDRQKCDACGKDLTVRWTDLHMEVECINCGCTYMASQDGSRPICNIRIEAVNLIKEYYEAKGESAGVGHFIGQRSSDRRYGIFIEWAEKNRPDMLEPLRSEAGDAATT